MDPNELMMVAIRAALVAGREILAVYRTAFTVDHKSDDSPLTLADRRAHDAIVDGLGDTGIPILSEEGRDIPYEERRSWSRLWIVDPLDGTKEFIKKNDEFTVNIALIERNRPVLGVVFVPVYHLFYFGLKGTGAYRLDREQTIDAIAADSAGSTLTSLLNHAERLPLEAVRNRPFTIIGSRSHATPELTAYVENARKRHERVDFISAGSSLKFCRVAEGTADVYPRLGPTMEWDTAAGQAVVENANARVVIWGTDAPLSYNREDLLNPNFIVQRPLRKDSR